MSLKMIKRFSAPGFILALIFLMSCVPSRKTYYAYGLRPGQVEKIDQRNYGDLQKIQVGDVVSIRVTALDQEQADVFNPFTRMAAGGGGNAIQNVAGVGGRGIGYLVDRQGRVELPLVGHLTLAGASTRDAREIVRLAVSKYIKEPWVDVAVISYRISMLGEIGRQGQLSITNERLSVIEAITEAGGLLPTARFDRVWLIREENGERAYHLLNINDPSIFNSEYYYLRNNDIIYVEPNKTKQFLGANAPYLQFITLTSSLVAITLTLVNLLK